MMRPIAFNGIKNDVLDVLLMQEKLPQGIGSMLVEMYHDKTYDVMWRDYCVQFMSSYYETRWLSGKPTDQRNRRLLRRMQTEQQAIMAAYRDALTETASTIAGTALIGLDALSERDEGIIAPDEVAKAAVEMLGNPTIAEPARISAFAVAASHGVADALPEARIIAQTGETIPVRMAAIALLGKLGTPADVELLSALAWNAEPRLKRLVESAIESLQQRYALRRDEDAPHWRPMPITPDSNTTFLSTSGNTKIYFNHHKSLIQHWKVFIYDCHT